MPHLSLPNQPMNTQETVEEILSQCDLEHTQKIGLVGWKNFTSTKEDNYQLFDLPHFLVHAVQSLCPKAIRRKCYTSFYRGKWCSHNK